MPTFRKLALASALLAAFAAPALAVPIAVRVQNTSLEPDFDSAEPAVSADGKTVVFVSNASNLAGPGAGELFHYDVLNDAVRALTTSVDGNAFATAVSQDGRYVAFTTDDNELGSDEGGTPGCIGTGSGNDVLRADTSTTPPIFLRVTRAFGCTFANRLTANASSESPEISGDGNFVAFLSSASNLLASPTTTGRDHLFEMDMTTRALTLVTRSGDGSEANAHTLPLQNNAYSRDGRLLVFATDATNLATVNSGNVSDVILRRIDRGTGQVTFENLNRSLAGVVGDQSSNFASLSPNGRYAIFLSNAGNLMPGGRSASRFYVRDLEANTLRGLPLPPNMGSCSRARIDDRGDAVLHCQPLPGQSTLAQQLHRIAADGTITLLSRSVFDGGLGNGRSGSEFSVSADGRMLVTDSAATNLIEADGNGATDVFMIAEPEVFFEIFRNGFE